MKLQGRQKAVIIGCGNLAWHLAKKLSSLNTFEIEVYNHRPNPALNDFESVLNCAVFENTDKINKKAGYYFICVNDQNIKAVSKKIRKNPSESLVVHFSGSTSINELFNKSGIKGVIYPLQTFSKQAEINWTDIPLFIEAEGYGAEDKIKTLAGLFSEKIIPLNSAQRSKLHLCAVMVNNFSNALYVQADNYLRTELKEVDFKLFSPIIEQTALKLRHLSPATAQTGPAKRGDKKIMKEHLALLSEHRELKNLYKQFSSIIQNQKA